MGMVPDRLRIIGVTGVHDAGLRCVIAQQGTFGQVDIDIKGRDILHQCTGSAAGSAQRCNISPVRLA